MKEIHWRGMVNETGEIEVFQTKAELLDWMAKLKKTGIRWSTAENRQHVTFTCHKITRETIAEEIVEWDK